MSKKKTFRHNLKAVIFNKKGHVLSTGFNNYLKTHPYMKKLAVRNLTPEKLYLHAEVAAILRCKDLSKAHRILITRVGKSGDLLLAKPCKICQTAIKAAGISIIEHS